MLVDCHDPAGSTANPRAAKCCGGLLAPDAQKMLSALGLGLPASVLENPQLFVVKAIDLERRLERCYQRHYINMHRGRFDAWLLSLVPGEVEVRTDCRLRSVRPADGRFDLDLIAGRRAHVERARLVIGADGVHSLVRRLCFADCPKPKQYFAVQEWFEADHAVPYFTSLFDRRITDYYCWTIPKDGRLVVGAAVHPAREATQRFELLKTALQRRGFEFGRTIRREGAMILRPTRINQICTACAGVALIGEAAGWISPSSAEGLSYAFRSAMLLAESVDETLDGFESRYDA
ncbi:MAG TPA: FAD-binding protein, partial [Planctomycetaceae bacterium]|nr:FAD-binding protein [Planctomycetaceae bacterium]